MNWSVRMEDTLLEFMQQEQAQKQAQAQEQDNIPHDIIDETDDDRYYENKTMEYYKQLGVFEFLSAAYFTITSCYICGIEYIKYKVGWKSKTNAIIDVAKRLALKNMLYVKMFQAYATNRTILNNELNTFFSNYTDNVAFTDDEYDILDLKKIEEESIKYYPYKRLHIDNGYKPIKSGLMSLIFKGSFHGDDNNTTPIVVKYLRKNIHNKFNSSVNNLVLFAKFTKKIPYIRTLNIENVILQNIVCLKDQICFRKEVNNIHKYHANWKDCEYIKIPFAYSEFTENLDPNIIVMEYIDGFKLDEIEQSDSDEFGKLLASFNAKAAFCNSLYHGDLHPGNILFIKEPVVNTESNNTGSNNTGSDNTGYIYKIGILDYGIIGHMTRIDQEIMFNLTKLVYQRKYKKIINYIVFNISELLDQTKQSTIDKYDVKRIITDNEYHRLCEELHTIFVSFARPQIKILGVNELYEINYILNKYGLAFKRTLYKLLITIAIMDSIGTRLGTKMSYIQYMTDIVVDLFEIENVNTVSMDDDHF